VSKDSDCSLVSKKNFSEILPCNGWHLGPGEMGQGGLKILHLWHHSQKIHTPNQKYFFRVQTRRLAVSYEPLNSSPPLLASEFCARKATCDLVVFLRKSPKLARCQSVKL